MNAHQRRVKHRAEAILENKLYEAAAAIQDDRDDDFDRDDRTCMACSGTGGNPWDDGITPCEECDGEGRTWWL